MLKKYKRKLIFISLIFTCLGFISNEANEFYQRAEKWKELVEQQQQKIVMQDSLITHQQQEISEVLTSSDLNNQILFNNINKNYRNVSVSIYHATEKQTDNTPFITADQTDLRKLSRNIKVISVSQDLLRINGGFLDFNDRILLLNAGKLNGMYYVKDTMHERWKNKVDVLVAKSVNHLSYKGAVVIKVEGKQNDYFVLGSIDKNNN